MIPPDIPKNEAEAFRTRMKKFVRKDGTFDYEKFIATNTEGANPDDFLWSLVEQGSRAVTAMRLEYIECKKVEDDLMKDIANMKKAINDIDVANDILDERLSKVNERRMLLYEVAKEERNFSRLRRAYDALKQNAVDLVCQTDPTIWNDHASTKYEKRGLNMALKPSFSTSDLSQRTCASIFVEIPRTNSAPQLTELVTHFYMRSPNVFTLSPCSSCCDILSHVIPGEQDVIFLHSNPSSDDDADVEDLCYKCLPPTDLTQYRKCPDKSCYGGNKFAKISYSKKPLPSDEVRITYNKEPIPSDGAKIIYSKEPLPSDGAKVTRNKEPFLSKKAKITYNKEPMLSNRARTTYNKEFLPSDRAKVTYSKEPLPSPRAKITYNKEPLPLDGAKVTYHKKPFLSDGAKITYNNEPLPLDEHDLLPYPAQSYKEKKFLHPTEHQEADNSIHGDGEVSNKDICSISTTYPLSNISPDRDTRRETFRFSTPDGSNSEPDHGQLGDSEVFTEETRSLSITSIPSDKISNRETRCQTSSIQTSTHYPDSEVQNEVNEPQSTTSLVSNSELGDDETSTKDISSVSIACLQSITSPDDGSRRETSTFQASKANSNSDADNSDLGDTTSISIACDQCDTIPEEATRSKKSTSMSTSKSKSEVGSRKETFTFSTRDGSNSETENGELGDSEAFIEETRSLSITSIPSDKISNRETRCHTSSIQASTHYYDSEVQNKVSKAQFTSTSLASNSEFGDNETSAKDTSSVSIACLQSITSPDDDSRSQTSIFQASMAKSNSDVDNSDLGDTASISIACNHLDTIPEEDKGSEHSMSTSEEVGNIEFADKKTPTEDVSAISATFVQSNTNLNKLSDTSTFTSTCKSNSDADIPVEDMESVSITGFQSVTLNGRKTQNTRKTCEVQDTINEKESPPPPPDHNHYSSQNENEAKSTSIRDETKQFAKYLDKEEHLSDDDSVTYDNVYDVIRSRSYTDLVNRKYHSSPFSARPSPSPRPVSASPAAFGKSKIPRYTGNGGNKTKQIIESTEQMAVIGTRIKVRPKEYTKGVKTSMGKVPNSVRTVTFVNDRTKVSQQEFKLNPIKGQSPTQDAVQNKSKIPLAKQRILEKVQKKNQRNYGRRRNIHQEARKVGYRRYIPLENRTFSFGGLSNGFTPADRNGNSKRKKYIESEENVPNRIKKKKEGKSCRKSPYYYDALKKPAGIDFDSRYLLRTPESPKRGKHEASTTFDRDQYLLRTPESPTRGKSDTLKVYRGLYDEHVARSPESPRRGKRETKSPESHGKIDRREATGHKGVQLPSIFSTEKQASDSNVKDTHRHVHGTMTTKGSFLPNINKR